MVETTQVYSILLAKHQERGAYNFGNLSLDGKMVIEKDFREML
jgi:hypothetical protein